MNTRTIQERLRDMAPSNTFGPGMYEAADEIDRLHSALATARREALEETDAEIVSELGEFYESGMRRFGGAAEADVQAVLTMAQKAMFTIIAQATALQTEKTMHAAWRKRAEEAERALLSQSVEDNNA